MDMDYGNDLDYYEPCMCCGKFGHWAQDCPTNYRMNQNVQRCNQQRGGPDNQSHQRDYNHDYYPRGSQGEGSYQNNCQNQGGQSELDDIWSAIKKLTSSVESVMRQQERQSKDYQILIEHTTQLATFLSEVISVIRDTQISPYHKSPNTTSVAVSTCLLPENSVVETHSPQGVESLVNDTTAPEGESEHDQEAKSFTNFENGSNKMFSEVNNLKVPFPLALIAHEKLSKREPPKGERWESFEKVKINKPLLEQIKDSPDHVECLEELSTQKQRHKFPKQLDLNVNVNAVLMGTLPPKLQDPGAPIISIQIGDFKLDRALLDLGACVSVLPGSLYDQFEFGPLQKVKTTVVLADQTPKCPRGIVKDVIVKVGEFYYPVDFLVLDCEKNDQPTIILGRPFLATALAIINCAEGTVRMRFGEKKLSLKVFSNSPNHKTDKNGSSMKKNPKEGKECFMIDRLNEKKESGSQEKNKKSRRRRNKKRKKCVEFDLDKATFAWYDQVWEELDDRKSKKKQSKEGDYKHPTRPP